MQATLLEPTYHRLLPTPLAQAAEALARETAASGEHTTADELVACIEALFGLLGRVWVAEYLATGAPDPAVNRLLHERLVASGGRVLGGQWLGVARSIRAAFLALGRTPVAAGLLDVDFGERDDAEHPFARLAAYRNSFAHGSFQSVVGDIRAHRSVLEGVLARLPFLVEQPFLLDTGDGVHALRGAAERVQRPASALPEGHPCLVGADGAVVDLYPLAVGRDASGTLALAWPGKRDAGPRDLVKHVRFQAWFERYRRELDGHVEACATCLGAPAAWGEASAALEGALGGRARGLVLVETAPGAPRAGILAGWADADTLRWAVEPGSLMGSGLVLVRAILRACESRLGLPDGSIPFPDPAAWTDALRDAAARLEEGGVVLRIAVENLHLGDTPSAPGEPSVQEVWRALASGPFLALGGAVRLWSLRPLPWDARVALEWQATRSPGSGLQAFLDTRAATPLARGVLALLGGEGAPLDLFEVCDRLEAQGGDGTVMFEPEVERTLWDLAPVLTLGRSPRATETVRTFMLLDATLIRSAMETRT